LEDPGVDGDNIKMGLTVSRRVCRELIWLKMGTNGGFYGHGKEISFYVKLLGTSRIAEELIASQEGLCFVEMVRQLFSLLKAIYTFGPYRIFHNSSLKRLNSISDSCPTSVKYDLKA
jgi:hypothetical protein